MGFPTWTLYGMAIGALAALLMIALAYIGLSPRFMRKLGLDVYRLDLRVRAFIGYAFAFLLIAFGFFLAGVPLDGAAGIGAALAGDTPTPDSEATDVAEEPMDEEGSDTGELDDLDSIPSSLPSATFTRPATSNTPVTGAFGGPPPGANTATPTGTPADAEAEATDDGEANSPTPEITEPAGSPTGTAASLQAGTTTSTPSITPSSTPTETPSPTITPSPTWTPTPITGETAIVDSDGSNVWIYRSPGGQQLTLVSDNDVVILLPGHANQGGVLWQEIMTVDGMIGWIEATFLNFDTEVE